MGRVFLATRLELGGQVAIKILRGDVDLAKHAIERFRREAQAASRLRSENVVRVLDMGTTGEGVPFIVMERIVGKTLAAHLKDDGPFPLSRAADIVIDVCAVLAEAHAHAIIHRDVKSSNVALTRRPDGTELVKVLDFGIAKQTAAELSSLTETTSILGSPKYMSPEQIRDGREVGPRDDLWSLAVMLQEITTGAMPFEAFTVPGLFAKIVTEPPVSARTVRPDLPEAFEALLLKALEKDTSARFRDAAELAEALAPFASADGARRAMRVRPIFEHATALSPSEPPKGGAAREATTASTMADPELDVTNAPIARERPSRSEPPARATTRATRTLGVAALGLGLVITGAVWRARPSPAPSAAPVMSEAPPTLAMPLAPASSPSSPMPSAARVAAPPASAVPLASAKAVAPPAPAPVAVAPRPPPRASAALPTRAPTDDDFGPRQ